MGIAGETNTMSERHDKLGLECNITDKGRHGMECNTSWAECGSSNEMKGQWKLKIKNVNIQNS